MFGVRAIGIGCVSQVAWAGLCFPLLSFVVSPFGGGWVEYHMYIAHGDDDVTSGIFWKHQ